MKRGKVEDVMTSKVVSVSQDTLYAEIVEAMAEHRICAVPVVDAGRRVVGIVTEADLLRKEEYRDLGDRPKPIFEGSPRRRARAKASATDARGLMSAPAVVVTPAMSIPAAARLLAGHRIRQAPVVREDGRLAGIVSRADLLRVFLRSDEDIRAEIIREVLIHSLWQDPSLVHVRVNEGVVTLSGQVEAKSLVPIVVRLTAATEGVVDVAADLGYARDDTRPATYPRA